MRLLLLTANLPYPPASGGALRSYGIIQGLHQAGHELILLSFHDDKIAPDSTPLADYCTRIETVPLPYRTKTHRLRDLFFSQQTDIARRLYSQAFSQRLQALLTETTFDLIQFEGIEVVCYLPLAHQIQPTAKLCFDTFNAEYALQRVIFEVDRQDIKRWPHAAYSLIQSQRITRFEREMCQMADCVVAVSPEDADALRGFRADGRIHIVPNGIFVDQYTQSDGDITLETNALVFTGKMDYRPNVDAMLWFTDAILPKIQKTVSAPHLYIVGQQPHPRLAPLHDNPTITITGWVDSVKPYLQAADVYIAPLRMGSGTRLKLLEAMASGCAVVATSAAAAGLLSETKNAMIITDTESEMVKAIVNLLQNPSHRRELGEQARHTVRQHYDWQVLIPRLLAAYGEMGLG